MTNHHDAFRTHRGRKACLLGAALFFAPWTFPGEPIGIGGQAWAQQTVAGTSLTQATSTLGLEVRRGTVVRLPRPAASVFVADPEVADVQAQSSTLVYVFGRRAGTTTVYAVDVDGNVLFERNVVVSHSLGRLRGLVGEMAPGESIRVESLENGILVEGEVANASQAAEVKAISESFLGEDETLISRLEVIEPTQVSIHVKVAELSREVVKIFGINLDTAFETGNFLYGFSTGRVFAPGGGPPFTRFTDDAGITNSIAGSYSNNGVDVNGIVDLLEREGLITVLAQPNLTALSGETASFLAGGEFPIPIAQDDNEITIEFKEFGVSLAFTPTVLNSSRISLRVRPEVSELSDQGAIRLGELIIPALKVRRAETTIELGSGQSFAIGGLVSNNTRSSVEKVPGIGDVPVLGTLFRSSRFQRNETELVIIVTAYLVNPVNDRDRLRSPLDGLQIASDLERIVHGRLIRTSPAPASSNTEVETETRHLVGPAGFMLN